MSPDLDKRSASYKVFDVIQFIVLFLDPKVNHLPLLRCFICLILTIDVSRRRQRRRRQRRRRLGTLTWLYHGRPNRVNHLSLPMLDFFSTTCLLQVVGSLRFCHGPNHRPIRRFPMRVIGLSQFLATAMRCARPSRTSLTWTLNNVI